MRSQEQHEPDATLDPVQGFYKQWAPAVLAVSAVAVVATVALAGVLRSDKGQTELTIPAGSTIIAALTNRLSTEDARVGDWVEARVTEPIRFDHEIVIADGAMIRGEVVHAKGGGRIAGAPELTMRFTELEVDGERYELGTELLSLEGESDAAESAAQVGAGAAAGGLVGAVVGGSVLKGAAIGTVLGAGAAIATEGDQIVLPTGQRLSIRLTAPVTVTFREPPGADGS